MPPARPRPLPAATKRQHPTQAPDGGGDLTLDEVQLLRKALKLTVTAPRRLNRGLNRSTAATAGPSAATPPPPRPPRSFATAAATGPPPPPASAPMQ